MVFKIKVYHSFNIKNKKKSCFDILNYLMEKKQKNN
jgi:hypothetical protein